uniref:HEAT repeat domain-containing protein n=1 Tax=Thermomicrobium roseum TaxID=500 RepID=A0A7C5VXE6_THERO
MSLTIDHDYDTALIEGLRHPRPDIAETCAWVLGQRRTRCAVPALIAVLHERPNEIDVQAAAVIALGRIGDPGAFPALVEAAQSGPVRVRRAALRALTNLDPARARPILQTIAESDPSSGVREEARRLLGEEDT